MKKIFPGMILLLSISCEYHTIAPRTCYLSSMNSGQLMTYQYNSKNELISYTAPNIFSSTLSYDGSGKIISELDNGSILITYEYDKNHRLVIWSIFRTYNPSSNQAVVFSYNSVGQDTLKQFYTFDAFAGGYYLTKFVRMKYASTLNNNYSEKKTYTAASELLYTENYLWDTHPNPYLTNEFFINEPPPSNNITQYTLTIAGGGPTETNLSYTYNASGFPVRQDVVGYGNAVIYNYANCN